MSETTHQLAAIMFTDIVEYTALMGSDEPKALKILRKSREIQKKSIEKFRGKWLKEMGDGVLAQFSSAYDAVRCALEIQFNASSELEAKIRIGIHLGDVTIENEDVFGDGVNIASRIQAIADPGGIYISESVNEAIRSHSDVSTKYLSEVELKNVNHPIRTYYVSEDWLPVPTQNKIRTLKPSLYKQRFGYAAIILVIITTIILIWWSNRTTVYHLRSIAVLPITNLSGDPTVDVLMAGIHTDLRDEIAGISALRVPSRRSTAQYQESIKTIPQIAKELEVDAILEPDLREIGDYIDLHVRLILPYPEEKQIWSASFRQKMENIMSIYDDIALVVADRMSVDLTPEESADLSQTKIVDPEAYKAYITGLNYMYELTREGIDKSIQYFNKAIEIDSNYAPAYVGLSLAWGVQAQQGFKSMDEVNSHVEKAISKAIELDGKHPEVYYRSAVSATWGEWNWEEADKLYVKTIQLDPGHAKARAYYAFYLDIMQRFDEAEEQMAEAMRLDPHDFLIQGLYAMHLNFTRQFDKAIEVVNNTIEIDPGNATGLPALWAAYHNKGMYSEAYETAQKIYSEKKEYRALEVLKKGFDEGGYEIAMQRVAEAFILKMDTAYFPSWQIATLYTRANITVEGLDWLNKAYEDHDPNMPSISCDPIFDNLKDEPGFKELLARMNLSRN